MLLDNVQEFQLHEIFSQGRADANMMMIANELVKVEQKVAEYVLRTTNLVE